MLKGNDYVRVWFNKGGNHYLIYFPTGARKRKGSRLKVEVKGLKELVAPDPNALVSLIHIAITSNCS